MSRSPFALAAVALLAAVLAWSGAAAPAGATGALVNGAGSSYVALAMQQWVTDGTAQGIKVNYTPTGSPDGVQRYVGTQVNFAATEAEFRSFGTTAVPRGYQYVPDVAGAMAVMYNLRDRAGNKVDYLHLSQQTIARIFLGDITRWSDPAISRENAGFTFPDQPINVVYRSTQSGTTGLFYDFIQHAEPDLFNRWAARNQIPTNRRILELPPNFAPRTQGLSTSDQIAQFLAGGTGEWSISYDEFGYAKTYGVPSAWVQNGAGKWVLPYATNISAALESATLRPDLSQELSGVYASRNPLAYPISAYSYVVTQCAKSGDRPTCGGAYPDQGVIDTLAPWLRYIACDGQVAMARIGYSPLPPNLSQEIITSIGRLKGAPATERLSASNCNNPRFHGSLGAGATSPPDPFAQLPGGVCAAAGCAGGGGGGSGTGAGRGGSGAGPGGEGGAGTGPTAGGSKDAAGSGKGSGATKTDAADAAGQDGLASAELAGPRLAAPTAYRATDAGGVPPGPAAALLASLVLPAACIAVRRRRSST
ncbi:MAG: substrate-binding domain-containing protein [Acidimicrobiia bacterium]|nr:substrate-binding domain-containing protein [Acidimicrobiia bacterium]